MLLGVSNDWCIMIAAQNYFFTLVLNFDELKTRMRFIAKNDAICALLRANHIARITSALKMGVINFNA